MNRLLAGIGMSLFSAAALFGESLWLSRANSESGIFADRTAGSVGDIISIVVDEFASINGSISKSTNSASSVDNGIANFFYSGLGTIKGGEYPKVSADGESSNSGGGSISNTRSVSSTASVLVVDRLPNGNLVIEGARELVVAGETQYVIIRGVIRKDDIAADNTIMSSQIANAQVEFLEKGAIASAQKQGWIAKLLNATNIW